MAEHVVPSLHIRTKIVVDEIISNGCILFLRSKFPGHLWHRMKTIQKHNTNELLDFVICSIAPLTRKGMTLLSRESITFVVCVCCPVCYGNFVFPSQLTSKLLIVSKLSSGVKGSNEFIQSGGWRNWSRFFLRIVD